MKVTLIRHTRVAVSPGTCYGQTDVDVAETFPEEAARVKAALCGNDFDAVYSSPLQRCRKLAEYCGYPAPLLDNRLKELSFGDWEGKRWDDIQDPRLQEWFDNWMDVRAGGAESFLEQYNRVVFFLDELKEQNYHRVAVFAHGGTIRSALVYAGRCNFNQVFSDMVDYGSLTTIEI